MKPKQKRGAKLQILKRCCPRVKCFIDTDAGFNPIPSKTDLAPQHRFTNALKVLGDDHQKEKGVKVQISKDGKQLTLQQLEREYQDWIFLMHSLYDDEGNLGDDELVLLVTASNKESLGVTSDDTDAGFNPIPSKIYEKERGEEVCACLVVLSTLDRFQHIYTYGAVLMLNKFT